MKPLLVLRHVPHVSLGSVAEVLDEANLPIEQIDLFETVPERLPLDDSAGLLVLGGPMSANDVTEYPYLETELTWIREAVDRQLPTLGICLGAQLLAKSLGGRVYRNRVKEIGCFDLDMQPAVLDDRLFGQRRPNESVFQWHGDTFDLPPIAIHLARTGTCVNQAFRCGPSAYGVQFHVEMTPTLLEVWLGDAEFDGELVELGVKPDDLRRDLHDRYESIRDFSRCLIGRFAEICKDSSR